MKNILLTLVASHLFFVCQSQNHHDPFSLNDQGRLYMDLILDLPQTTKDQAFVKCGAWLARAFDNPEDANIYSDKESGIITGQGAVEMKLTTGVAFRGNKEILDYKINLFCKDGKSRIVIDNIYYEEIGLAVGRMPLEHYYWKKADPNNKERPGLVKMKTRIAESIASVLSNWEEEMKSGVTNYADF